MRFIVTVLLFLGSPIVKSVAKSSSYDVFLLEKEAFNKNQNDPSTRDIWVKILKIDPKNLNARLQLGMQGIFESDPSIQENSFFMLEETFDPNMVNEVIPKSVQSTIIASTIGRWRAERENIDESQKFFQIAQDYTLSVHGKPDECLAIQLASLLRKVPKSIEERRKDIEVYTMKMEEILAKENIQLNEKKLSEMIPGAAADTYVHCLLQHFALELYNAENVSHLASLHYQVAKKVWPDLVQPLPKPRNCRNKNKIKLGIISGFLRGTTPVTLDFRGVLKRLSRDKFEVTWIIGTENKQEFSEEPYSMYHQNDNKIILKKPETAFGSWPTRYHKQIWDLNLDIAFFLECTMSSHTHRLAMTRLAPVQAVSHGHPITSGIGRESMDYYISWGAAEMPDAQKYYTEKLLLLPSDSIHQFYESRLESTMEEKAFNELLKKGRTLFEDIPSKAHWYLSMQKPHKFQPEFDDMLCGILKSDPEGRLILHEPDKAFHNVFIDRLTEAECDMSRVHFLPTQPAAFLFALYFFSDVILDTYPFGGCTTTREALELGTAVVTLPSNQLGSRWSLAYYNIMGDETLNSYVIATSVSDYVHKVVQLGTNKDLRRNVEKLIKESFPKLFIRFEAVQHWEEMFESIAPNLCQQDPKNEL